MKNTQHQHIGIINSDGKKGVFLSEKNNIAMTNKMMMTDTYLYLHAYNLQHTHIYIYIYIFTNLEI